MQSEQRPDPMLEHAAWCDELTLPGSPCNCGAEKARLRARVAALTSRCAELEKALDIAHNTLLQVHSGVTGMESRELAQAIEITRTALSFPEPK